MAMFIGTLPEIHRHVFMIDKGFSTRKSQHSIVSEVCPGTEHLHLIVVFDTTSPPFIGTPCDITYCLTNQIVFHQPLTIGYCKDTKKIDLSLLFCEIISFTRLANWTLS
jgi:hypothetical protein